MGSPIDIRTSVTALGLLRKIALSSFREFTETDWDAFQGCESKDPLIADDVQYNTVGHTIVIDGDTINVIRDGDMYGGQLFRLVNMDEERTTATSPAPVADEAPRMDSDAVA